MEMKTGWRKGLGTGTQLYTFEMGRKNSMFMLWLRTRLYEHGHQCTARMCVMHLATSRELHHS